MKKLLALFIFVFLSMSMLYASVGKIVAAKGDITVLRDAKKIKAAAGFELEEKDVVNSIGKSKAQIIFNDKTVITIGKDSEFKINEYLFEAGKEPKASFGFAKGAFRSITGQIGKVAPDKFKLKTKTATIGIRGTQVLAQINGDNKIACTEGRIAVTELATGKTVEVKAGQITMVVPGKAPSAPRAYKPKEIKNLAGASGGGGEKMKADEVITEDSGDKKEVTEEDEEAEEDEAAEEEQSEEEAVDEGEAEEEEGDKVIEEEEQTEEEETQAVSETDEAAAPAEEAPDAEGTDDIVVGDDLDDLEADMGMSEEVAPPEKLDLQETFEAPTIDSDTIAENVKGAEDAAVKVNEDISSGVLDKKKPNPPQIINIKPLINDNTPIIEGTGEAGLIVELTVDEQTYTTTVGTDGTWSIEITTPLTEEAHTISVVTIDAVLNKSDAVEVSLSVDLTPPAALGSIDLAAASDTGTSDTDNVTDQKVLLITGSAAAGETVKIYSGNTQLGTATADSTGSWSFTTDELAEGEYLIKAVVSDAAGNSSESDILAVIIDITRIAQELSDQLLAAEIAQIETKPEVAVGLPGFTEHLNDKKVLFTEEDPYLSWGMWYDSADTAATPENVTGGWVSGEMTPSDVIDGYIRDSKSASYAGEVNGIVKETAASYFMENGSVNLNISYGAATPVSGNIQFDANSEHWNLAVGSSKVFNTGFTGALSTGTGSDVTINSGDMSGRFYGPNAESVGGQFQAGNGATVEESTKAAYGVFVGSK